MKFTYSGKLCHVSRITLKKNWMAYNQQQVEDNRSTPTEPVKYHLPRQWSDDIVCHVCTDDRLMHLQDPIEKNYSSSLSMCN